MAETKKAASTIGLKNFVIAKVLTDTDEGTTYDEVVKVAGAVEASITPNSSDADVQYADDEEYDRVDPDPDLSLKMKLVDIPMDIQQMLFASEVDNNGVVMRKAGDKKEYFACGFKSLKSDGAYRYVWLLKCIAKPITESYATKEGTTITRQNVEVEFSAMKRSSDDYYQFIADEGVNGFTAEMGKNFLNTVYSPVTA